MELRWAKLTSTRRILSVSPNEGVWIREDITQDEYRAALTMIANAYFELALKNKDTVLVIET